MDAEPLVRVGVATRRNSDSRDYKVLMSVSGDSLDYAIFPGEIRRAAARLASSLQTDATPDYIVGFAPGGIPIAMALGYELDVPVLVAYKTRLDLPDVVTFCEPHCAADTFYFYGARPGMSVVLVDDEADTGNTLYNAAIALAEAGVRVLDIGCAVEVLHSGRSDGRERLRSAGFTLKSLCTVDVAAHRPEPAEVRPG